jgi:hypothetical protein
MALLRTPNRPAVELAFACRSSIPPEVPQSDYHATASVCETLHFSDLIASHASWKHNPRKCQRFARVDATKPMSASRSS